MKTIKGFQPDGKMKALVLEKYDTIPSKSERDIPTPSKGEILIKIDSSPINPSDISFLKGMYSTEKNLPVVPGFEASGTVVASGDDYMSRRLLGKKVACFAPRDGHGCWAEYMVTSNKMAIPLKKSIDLEKGSMLMVNPLSTIAMLDIARKGGHKAIANTAAASALGQLMNSMCVDSGYPLVNIVRRDEQVELLKSLGAKYIINTSDSNFRDQMKKMFSELSVTLVFDAISGDIVSDLMEAMPRNGEVMIYGGLSEKPAVVHPGKVIFENKKVSGFWASEWIGRQSTLKLIRVFNKIQKHLATRHDTKVQGRFGLEDFSKALDLYKKNMTAGKVLIRPDLM